MHCKLTLSHIFTKRKIVLFQIVLGGLLAAGLINSIPIAAAQAAAPQATLGISPTSVDQIIKPGGTFSGYVYVLNQGNADFSYFVYALPSGTYRVTVTYTAVTN